MRSLTAVLTMVITLLTACRSGGEGVEKPEFDRVVVNTTEHLFGDSAKPACHISINMAYVKLASTDEMVDSLNTFILRNVLGFKYRHMQPEEAAKIYAESYVEDYRKDLEPTYAIDEKNSEAEVEAWYSYYRNVEGNVERYKKNILTYRAYYDEYTGGLHGIYMTHYINIDLRTLSLLTLDDIFAGDYSETLTDLLWEQLMKDNHVTTHKELEEMGYATGSALAPTQNFYLDREGITFYYNVYDIAPYIVGPVTICLPWETIKSLIDGEANYLWK